MRLLLCITLVAAALTGCDDSPLPPRAVPEAVCPAPVLAPDAGECSDLSSYAHTVGLLNTTGTASGVDFDAGYLYIADGDVGLVIVEACDPTAMSPVATLSVPGTALAVSAVDGRAYVAAGTGGVIIVDVADPARPFIAGRLRTAGSARDIAVVTRERKPVHPAVTAYVADDAVGLMIADLTDPLDPVVEGIENTPGSARGVCVVGDIAYVADAQLGLRIASVDDPASPWLVSAVPTPGEAHAVAVWNGMAIVADGSAGVVVVDVSSPAAAAVVGTHDTANSARDVVVVDGIAFVVDTSEGLVVLDVAAANAPARLTRISGEGLGEGVAVAGHIVFTADGLAGVRAIDARRPQSAPILGTFFTDGLGANGVIAAGDRFYVANDIAHLYIAEWRRDHFARLGDAYLGASGGRMIWYEDYLYVCVDEGEIRVVDVSNPLRARVVMRLPASDGATDIAVADSVALIVRGGRSLPVLLDLRDPNGPPVGVNTGFGVVTAVDVGASFGYFVQVQGKLFVTSRDASVSQPLYWTQLTNGNSTDVHVRGDVFAGGETLYIANRHGKTNPETGDAYSAGVEIYDLTNPLIPEFVTLIETSIPAERIAFDGDIMYVIGGADGLEAYDVADPTQARNVGSFWKPTAVRNVAVVPGALLLAVEHDGLLALPPACP